MAESSLIDANITIPASTLRTGSLVEWKRSERSRTPANNRRCDFQLKLWFRVVFSTIKPATTAACICDGRLRFGPWGFRGW